MQLQLIDDLPFVTVTAAYQGQKAQIAHVLVDTGSAGTILAADSVGPIGIRPVLDDIPRFISGVGGAEVVYNRVVDYLKVGECHLPNFAIEVGGMDYGFDIFGILGMDFLTQSGAVINLKSKTIEFGPGRAKTTQAP